MWLTLFLPEFRELKVRTGNDWTEKWMPNRLQREGMVWAAWLLFAGAYPRGAGTLPHNHIISCATKWSDETLSLWVVKSDYTLTEDVNIWNTHMYTLSHVCRVFIRRVLSLNWEQRKAIKWRVFISMARSSAPARLRGAFSWPGRCITAFPGALGRACTVIPPDPSHLLCFCAYPALLWWFAFPGR